MKNGIVLLTLILLVLPSQARSDDDQSIFFAATSLAEKGDSIAQFYVGIRYYNGKGVSQNYAEAFKWFLKASEPDIRCTYLSKDYADYEKTSIDAKYYLGTMYFKGQGVSQNYAEAIKWYKRATLGSNFSCIISEYALGCIYLKQEDYGNSYAWFSLAAAHGDQDAAKARDEITELVTPLQLEGIQKYATKLQTAQKNSIMKHQELIEIANKIIKK